MTHSEIRQEEKRLISYAHILFNDFFDCTIDEMKEGFNSFLSEMTVFTVLSSYRITYGFEGHFQEYDKDRLGLIAKYLPENPVIFEAGGNDGTDTVRFAQKWPLATIISFEPNPNSFRKFLTSTANFKNITGHNLAIGDVQGTATLHSCEHNDGASSLLEATDTYKKIFTGPLITVPCTILDNWCRAHHVGHIDFMWLDLEGMELQVLQSCPEMLNTVKVIYTETNFRQFRHGMSLYEHLKAFLEKAGFTLLAHWYLQGHQGDAIFIRKEIFDGRFTEQHEESVFGKEAPLEF